MRFLKQCLQALPASPFHSRIPLAADPVLRPLDFSIVLTDREPGTGYSRALWRLCRRALARSRIPPATQATLLPVLEFQENVGGFLLCPPFQNGRKMLGDKFVYSCFDKGCPTKALKRTRQCRLVLWVERVWR